VLLPPEAQIAAKMYYDSKSLEEVVHSCVAPEHTQHTAHAKSHRISQKGEEEVGCLQCNCTGWKIEYKPWKCFLAQRLAHCYIHISSAITLKTWKGCGHGWFSPPQKISQTWLHVCARSAEKNNMSAGHLHGALLRRQRYVYRKRLRWNSMKQTYEGGLQNVTSALMRCFHPQSRLLRDFKCIVVDFMGLIVTLSVVTSRSETKGSVS